MPLGVEVQQIFIDRRLMDQNDIDQATSRSVYHRATMHGRNRIELSARSNLGWSVFFLVVALNLCRTACGLSSDGVALLAFRNATTRDPKNALGNWNASDATPCAWNGVTCDDNRRVVNVALSRQRLVGQIPAELGNLMYLRTLNLHTNALFGPLPPELFSAAALKAIYLFENNLSGTLQPFVGQLTRLQRIDISSNGFVGGIPTEVSNLNNLLQLTLSKNNFSGRIPEGLGNSLQALQTLDLSFNQLTGGIPADLGNLSSLQGVLELSQNRLSGSIPASLADLPAAVSIDVRGNTLSGPIPPIFAEQHRIIEAGQNEGLCGAPLSNPCPSSPTPEQPLPAAAAGRRGLSKEIIIAIVVGDVCGIVLVVLIFECCLRRKLCRRSCLKPPPKKGDGTNNSSEEFSNSLSQEVEAWCICCAKTTKAGSEASEKIEPGELIRLDKDVKFDLEELLRASAYVLGKSSSGSGVVYKAMLEGGMTVAVRRLGEGGAQEYKEFESEVKLIGKIRHPNIVSLRAYYWAVDEKLLVYDFIPNGSLAMALHDPAKEPLDWAKRLKIAQGCARGLAYIHACGVGKCKLVHKDIKPSNILLNANMEAKISDLGLPRLQSLAAGRVSKSSATPPEGIGSVLPRTTDLSLHDAEIETLPGRRDTSTSSPHVTSPSSCYYPPESITDEKQRPTQAWDVYSFGVLLLELLTGRSPLTLLGNDHEGMEQDLVSWVRRTVEERKPVTEVLDTHMSEEIILNRDVQHEFEETLRIALECTNDSPEMRPLVSYTAAKLEQIGRRLEISFSD